MKFIADVNIASKVINLLRQTGHDVLDIKKLNLLVSDTKIIKLARKNSRIILTHDRDFLGLAKFPKYQVGIIVIRLNIQNASHHYDKLSKALGKHSEEVLNHSLTILTEDSIELYSYIQK